MKWGLIRILMDAHRSVFTPWCLLRPEGPPQDSVVLAGSRGPRTSAGATVRRWPGRMEPAVDRCPDGDGHGLFIGSCL